MLTVLFTLLSGLPADESTASPLDWARPGARSMVVHAAPRHDAPLTIIADNLLLRIGADTQLPSADNARVQRELKFLLAAPHALRATLKRSAPYLFNIVTSLEHAKLPTGLAMLPAIESAFDPMAVSHMHAAGLWQFIPATGDRYGLTQNRLYDGRHNPADSTRAAVRFLAALGQHYDGDWLLALAAYNTGPGNVDRAIAKARRKSLPVNYWNLSLPRETMDYVPKLLALLKVLAEPDRYNVSLPFIANEPSTHAIELGTRFSLSLISDFTGLSIEQLRRHNPAIKADSSPPEGPHVLQLPVAAARAVQRALREQPDRIWHNVPAVHTVVSGDSLSQLARTYQTSVDRLRAWNNLPDTRIGIGAKLTVGLAPARARTAVPEKADASCQAPRQLDYRYATHTVQSGDSIWSIARALGTQSTQLREWNDIDGDARVLSIGEQMHHAALKPDKAQPARVIRYRASATDTAASIAEKFGITTMQLRRCNATLRARGRLSKGQRVLVPLGPS